LPLERSRRRFQKTESPSKSALGWLAVISTPRLKPLRVLHLEPINVVVFDETITPNLGVGFALRCFQRLSLPDIATRRFSWYQSRQTRGRFSPVLSSCLLRKPQTDADLTQTVAETNSFITEGIDYIFTRPKSLARSA
jgi:hypothetical protein